MAKKPMKELSKKDSSSAEKEQITDAAAAEEDIASGPGLSSGNPHQIPKDLHDHRRNKRLNKSWLRFTKVGPIRVVCNGFHRLGHGVIGGIGTITGSVRRLSGQVEDHMPSVARRYQAGGDEPPVASRQPPPQLRETGETGEPETGEDSKQRNRGSTLARNEAVSRENGNGSPQRTRTLPTAD